jgi:hypothetical protein
VTSPAHRAAIGFLQGALVAVAAEVVASPLAGSLSRIPAISPLAPAIRTLVPLAGFSVAGAVGGEAIGEGRLGTAAFAAGGLGAGLVLTMTSPHLSGLTGYEDALIVLAYAACTFALAFGLCGCLAGAILRPDIVMRATAAFAFGGALGGLAGILPFLLARFGSAGPGDLLWQFVWLASSIASIATPLAVGGALTARVMHGGHG